MYLGEEVGATKQFDCLFDICDFGWQLDIYGRSRVTHFLIKLIIGHRRLILVSWERWDWPRIEDYGGGPPCGLGGGASGTRGGGCY